MPLSNGDRTPSAEAEHHPDLANEVAALSTKLINAINHQTNLDDALQRSRHELEAARNEIAQLKAAAQERETLVTSGALVNREHTDKIEQTLKTEAADERLRRIGAEREKKKIELELERLTSELFEEANTMVADARREKQEAEQQKEQYQTQLRDAEILLASHQEQLRELKDVMQQLHMEERVDELQPQPSAPSTPIVAQHGRSFGIPSQMGLLQRGSSNQVIFPDHPLSFSNLISPVLRSDIQPYEEFIQLLKLGGSNSPSSRGNSGNFVGLNVMGLGSLSHPHQSKVEKLSQTASKNSSSSLSSSSPGPPNMPGAFNSTSTTDLASSPSTISSLKEAKYYKRAVSEDIEPTLRLDIAPGLSWLARRNVISSMANGNLIVDPFPAGSNSTYPAAFPCGLCGEMREGDAYVRRHRFRISDNDEAQRYPVCDYCVGRLRATGDFVNFLRMVRSGYWRGEKTEEARLAWEECLRLRERMFWSRIGGGVVPSNAFETPGTPRRVRHHADRSISSTNLDSQAQDDGEEEAAESMVAVDVTNGPSVPRNRDAEPATEPPTLPARPAVNLNQQQPAPASANSDTGIPTSENHASEQATTHSPTRPEANVQSSSTDSAERRGSSPSKARGLSVGALRSRFEAPSPSSSPTRATAGASPARSETSRPASRQRTAKSRTPSPEKQF